MSKHAKRTFELPWWYRQEPQKFMSSPDVEMMTCEEIGSYFLLLQKAWLLGENCTLPNDPQRLAKLARIDKVSDLVISKFVLDKDGKLYNPRLSMEWADAVKRSKDGTKANATRWKKGIRPDSDRTSPAMPAESDSNPTTQQNTTEQNTTKQKSKTAQAHASSSTSGEAVPASTQNPARPVPGAAAKTCAGNLAKLLGRENLKPTTLDAWAEQVQPLLTRADEQTLTALMHWALTNSGDSFWRGRLLSMKHFVRSFNTIKKQFESGQKSANGTDPLAARAASLKTGHDFSYLAKGDV